MHLKTIGKAEENKIVPVQQENSQDHYIPPFKLKSKYNPSDHFSFLVINIRSLNKNFNKLVTLIENLDFKPQIISVSETWINNSRPFLYNLEGYTFINQPSEVKVGGAGFFIKDEIQYIISQEFKIKLHKCDNIWITVSLPKNNKIVIGSIYRNPDYNFQDFQDKFIQTIEKLNNKNTTYLIGGDLNIDLMKKTTKIEQYLIETESLGCIQTVAHPTRIQINTTSSLIDHIYTSLLNHEIHTELISHEVSDHLPVISFIEGFKGHRQPIVRGWIRDEKKFNCEQFLKDLERDLHLAFTMQESANDTWNLFENIYLNVLNKHAPFKLQSKKKAKHNINPWFTKRLQKTYSRKQKLFRKFLRRKTVNNWNSFKRIRNKLNREMKQTKQNFFRQKISQNKSNSKKLWNTLNDIVQLRKGKSISTITLAKSPNDNTDDPYEVSNIFNEHFSTVGQRLSKKLENPSSDHKISPTSNIKQSQKSFFLQPITEKEVKLYIQMLNINKASKSDSIPTKYIKFSSKIISSFLMKIFNQCMSQGVFPDKLKTAEIIPIFKKGNKTNPSNYRPISLLSAFSKIFERHIYVQIHQFLTKHKLLYRNQYAFREFSTTDAAVSQISEQISSKIEDGLVTCATFVDLAKAFDTIDFKILTNKLHSYGIRGLPAKLISNYLSNRKQNVTLNGKKSKTANIKCGVPQGSILGPLLFLIYINDLPNSTQMDVKLFADDACFIQYNQNFTDLEKTTNMELAKVDNWMKTNKLTINYDKTNYIIFTKQDKNVEFKLQMNSNTIQMVQETKYLGVIIDANLNWKSQIQTVKTKLSRACYIMSKIKHYVDSGTLKMIYYSLIFPHINYCVCVWGGVADYILKPLIILQKRAIRIITKSDYKAHTAPLFKQLKILNFDSIYTLSLANIFHKIQHDKILGTFNLKKLDQIHQYETRLATSNNYYSNSFTTNLGKNTFIAAGIRKWRNIPTKIKSLPNHLFKTEMKILLLEKQK